MHWFEVMCKAARHRQWPGVTWWPMSVRIQAATGVQAVMQFLAWHDTMPDHHVSARPVAV